MNDQARRTPSPNPDALSARQRAERKGWKVDVDASPGVPHLWQACNCKALSATSLGIPVCVCRCHGLANIRGRNRTV